MQRLRHLIALLCAPALLGSMALLAGRPAASQTLGYNDPSLYSIYPAGGQQGQSVAVELRGVNGLADAKDIVIDGPPGVTVSDVKAVDAKLVQATLTIAPDAPLGRRLVRVVGSLAGGLSNFRQFLVGPLPEVVEQEPNNTPEAPQDVTTPAVINGRINPTLDIDCYRFQATAGQQIVAAVLAHRMDAFLDVRGGFLDTSLELVDSAGAIVAASDDALGRDPLISVTVPADGRYMVRVSTLGYKGSDHAVYRLTLGEVPYPTAVFPVDGRRGSQVEVELSGPNVPQGTKRTVTIGGEGNYPIQWLVDPQSGADLPLMRSDLPGILESEPNDKADQATPLGLPAMVNGRFLAAGDEDWYRLRLAKGQGVLLKTVAQRLLGSPVDTVLEVYNAEGKQLAANDDGAYFANECTHDFNATDSWLELKAKADGEYLVRVRDQSGSSGPGACYLLSAEPLVPDFALYQWPDGVPVWGPGTTAAFVVQLMHWGGLEGELEARIEGLPEGWQGSVLHISQARYGPYKPPYGYKMLMTITAPPDAERGTAYPFRVIGRVEHDGHAIEHEAHYLTLYGNSHNDRMHLRDSPKARVALAGPQDSWLETDVMQIDLRVGEMVEIPVRIHRREGSKATIGLVANGPTVSAGCGWGSPITLGAEASEFRLPLKVGEQPPGHYSIVVARSWASDLRNGRPGPCTPLIQLNLLPAEK